MSKSTGTNEENIKSQLPVQVEIYLGDKAADIASNRAILASVYLELSN